MTATEPLTTKSDTEKITCEKITSVVCECGGGGGGGEGVVGGKTGALRRDGVLRQVRSLVSASGLKELLLRHGFDGWATSARVTGLMLLVDYVVRCSTGKGRRGSLKSGVPVSAELARCFVSPLRTGNDCLGEPLAVLCRVGLLERVFTGSPSFCSEASRYRITERYLPMVKRRFRVRVGLGRLRKLESWRERYVKRLSVRLPFLPRLVRDLQTVTLSDEGRVVATRLLSDKCMRQVVCRFLEALDGSQRPLPKVTRTGTVITFVSGCPRDLKPYLLLADERVVLCDVSSAHWALVPRLVIDWTGGSVDDELGRELERYRASFDNDFYLQFCRDAAERNEKKLVLNMLLNAPQGKCESNRLWGFFRFLYPRIARIIESIKRDDHRQICHRLQRYTAQATNSALYELQQRQIGCVPDTDSLIVPYSHHEVACAALKRHFRAVSRGVDVRVKTRSIGSVVRVDL